ncbi:MULTISPECIES: hormogonium polysaccharide biosynthesis glycosyltransferase HpsE [Okeania]|uniref:Glycosyltransferase family 2 protein n=3 Tax=Okeania TaxID=1458928 RepID=A0A3N6NUL6_9CYAN|nr:MULTISPECIES: hormogonium polysaccharide biosynthesis glycosyltransferase HpsE [Okeania]NES77073.1 glycosyltransferase family 2 protein [Okeania sp. SIO1H4]NET21387.1 glycosyltransferase family 2 protein [Okeania sp. SIO1H5]NET77215.1 glycosyltransferase family 2 protein [Okeania sp. SIO1F9]NET93949.1 glycosyltransferase family 2 protein [Okeania sp. SIO1H2]RQH20420.1 glycosyltransferase family 2 protein [Okeania hirsuta]
MIDFTVAIRAYNSAKNLPQILGRLKNQVGIEEIDWEIVIVDNNSTDNTAKIVANYQSNWGEKFPLKYFTETRQGCAFARRKAMEKAQGSLVGFIDDDNLPALDWVAKAYAFGKSHPKVGAYGGQIHGEFEVEPPQNFQKIAVYLAIIERGQKAFCYKRKKKVLPPGAGTVVSKKAWLESVPENLFLTGTAGKSLALKGEDMEVFAHIQNAGWEIWYNPEMHLHHMISSSRLERNYLLSLARGSGLHRNHIRMIRLKPWQRPLAFFAYLVNDSRKALSYFIKNYNLLKTDIVAACEMTLLLSILVSPFYLWKVQLYQELKVRQQSHQISAVADMKGDVQSEGKSLSLPNLSS